MSNNVSFIYWQYVVIIIAFGMYIVGSFLVPFVPYQSDTSLIYPLLILYKYPIFHIVFLTVCVIGMGYFSFAHKLFNVSCLMMLLVGLVLLVFVNIFATDYHHHDYIEMDGIVYQLGSSNDSDWATLQYLVYQCDATGIICILADIPYSGLNRSQLPTVRQTDRYAQF